MSIASSEYKPLRKSQSLPHIIASRHDSNVSGITVSTGIGTSGSCSILDRIGYNTMCNNHHHHNHNQYELHHHHHHHHQYHFHQHPHFHRNHKKHENMSTRLVADLRQLMTLRQHYYPEGGWGWLVLAIGFLVQAISHGLHMAIGVLITAVAHQFQQNLLYAGMIGSLSIAIGLVLSPVTIALCRKKSTRLLAVIGGLVTTLGCLFSSFALQFHQMFFSYGIIVGIGVGMTRDCSTLMIAQYFKKKREFVEIIVVAGSGLGVVFMSNYFKKAIDAFGWRHGMQCITLTVFLTFFLGLFYRSASLYHPQRRAILHLKNQRRKVKDKNRHNNRTPFFDFKTLRSKTVRITLASTACSAFGLYLPIVHLAHQLQVDGLDEKMLVLQTNMGLAWMLGAFVFGFLVIRSNAECRIARQYLCQASLFMCAICLLALAELQANYEGYFIIVWAYGFFCGGYHYAMRVYIYERVRARNFAQTWSFVQFAQGIPIVLGTTAAEYLNRYANEKCGYLFGFVMVLCGSLLLFLIDMHRRNVSRHKHTRSNGSRHLCMLEDCPENRRLSFSQEAEHDQTNNFGMGTMLMHTEAMPKLICDETEALPNINGNAIAVVSAESPIVVDQKPELTCISEEGIADMDLPDNMIGVYPYADHITSCSKVENYLRLSEYENNLQAEMSTAAPTDYEPVSATKAIDSPTKNSANNEQTVLNISNSTANINNNNNCTRLI